MSANDAPGPQHDTTSVGENIELNLRQNFKEAGREEAANAEMTSKVPAKGGAVKCRICSGEHFTARCPFKGTMAPEGEPSGEPVQDPLIAEAAVGTVKGAYVAPGRRGGDRPGEKMAGKFERDDLATLRVTNVKYSILDRQSFTNSRLGQRIRRRIRTPRLVRALWSCHEGVSCKGPRHWKSKRLRFRQLC